MTAAALVALGEWDEERHAAQDRELAGTSLRGPLTRENFYFVMADRFSNGSAASRSTA